MSVSETVLPAGVSDQFDKAGFKRGIDPKIVKQERKKKYELTRKDRFLYRSRYFTDAGIIGSPVKSCFACHFVNFTGQARSLLSPCLDKFKHLLNCKPERKFTPVGGVEGVYSMKRLA